VYLRERADLTWEEVKEQANKNPPHSDKKKAVRVLKKQHTILFSVVPSRDLDSGKKMITSDDELTESDEETTTKPVISIKPTTKDKTKSTPSASEKKPMCRYADQCFRTNPAHLAKYAHNTRATVDGPSTKKKEIPCKFGKLCQLNNPYHQQKYSHNAEEEEIGLTKDEKLELKGDVDDEPSKSEEKDDEATQIMDDNDPLFQQLFNKSTPQPPNEDDEATLPMDIDPNSTPLPTNQQPSAETITITKKQWNEMQEMVLSHQQRIIYLEQKMTQLQNNQTQQQPAVATSTITVTSTTQIKEEKDAKRRKITRAQAVVLK